MTSEVDLKRININSGLKSMPAKEPVSIPQNSENQTKLSDKLSNAQNQKVTEITSSSENANSKLLEYNIDINKPFKLTQEMINKFKTKGEKGFFESLKDGVKNMIPFASGIKAAYAGIKLLGIVKKQEKGEKLSNKEKEILYEYILNQAEEQHRGSSFMGKVGAMLSHLPAFAGEFLLTGGIYSLGKTLAQKTLTKGLQSVTKQQLGKFITKSITEVAIGSAARAAAMPHRVLENYTSRRVNLSIDKETSELKISENKEHWLKSLGKASIDNYIEMLSEQSGAGFSFMLSKPLGKIPYLGKLFVPNAQTRAFMSKTGFNGLFEEYAEERLGGTLRVLTGLDERKDKNLGEKLYDAIIPGWEQTGVELTTTAIWGGTLATVTNKVNKFSNKNQNKPYNNNSGEPQYFYKQVRKSNLKEFITNLNNKFNEFLDTISAPFGSAPAFAGIPSGFEAQQTIKASNTMFMSKKTSKKSSQVVKGTNSGITQSAKETEILDLAGNISKIDYELGNKILDIYGKIKSVKIKTVSNIYDAIKANNEIFKSLNNSDLENLIYFLNSIPKMSENSVKATETALEIMQEFNKMTEEITNADEKKNYFRTLTSIIRKFNTAEVITFQNISEELEIFALYKKYKTTLCKDIEINKLYYEHQDINKKHNIKLSFKSYLEFKNIGFVNSKIDDFINSFNNYRLFYPNTSAAMFIEHLKKYNEFVEKLAENNNWLPKAIAGAIHSSDEIQQLLINDKNINLATNFLSGVNLGELIVSKNVTENGTEIEVFDKIRIQRNGNISAELSKNKSKRIKHLIKAFERLALRTYPSLKKMQHEHSLVDIINTQMVNSFTERLNGGYFYKGIEYGGEKISFQEFFERNKSLVAQTVRKINNSYSTQNLSIHAILRVVSRNLQEGRVEKQDLEKFINGKYASNINNLLNGFIIPDKSITTGLILPNGEIIQGFALEKAKDGEFPGISVYTATQNNKGEVENVYFYTYNGEGSLRTFYRLDHLSEEKRSLMDKVTKKRAGRSLEIKLN